MDFIEVETFLAVADSLNLTKAAEMLHVSQSTVTHRLKNLEDELHYQLILRQQGRRSMELTPRGEAFLSIARRWMGLHREIEALENPLPRPMAIASDDEVLMTALPALLCAISKKECARPVTLQTADTPKIYELMRKREADIGFVSADACFPEIVIRPVFRQKYVLVRTRRGLGTREKIHPRDLDPAGEILLPWGHDYMKWHDYWWPREASHIRIDSLMALPAFLCGEERWAIVPSGSLKTVLKWCQTEVFDLLEGPPEKTYYMVKHKSPEKQSAEGIAAFERVMREFLEKTDFA